MVRREVREFTEDNQTFEPNTYEERKAPAGRSQCDPRNVIPPGTIHRKQEQGHVWQMFTRNVALSPPAVNYLKCAGECTIWLTESVTAADTTNAAITIWLSLDSSEEEAESWGYHAELEESIPDGAHLNLREC